MMESGVGQLQCVRVRNETECVIMCTLSVHLFP